MTGRQSIRCAVERMLWRGVFMALAAVFLTVLLPVLWDLFSPFLIGLAVAALLRPLIALTQEKLHMRRGVAVGLWVQGEPAGGEAPIELWTENGERYLPVELPTQDDFALYVIVPYRNGFAPIGLCGKFLSPKTIASADGETVRLKEGGTFAFVKDGRLVLEEREG